MIRNIKLEKKFSEFDLNINLPNKKKLNIKKIKIPLLGFIILEMLLLLQPYP